MNENLNVEEIVKDIVKEHLNDPDHNIASIEIVTEETGYKIITKLLSDTEGYYLVDRVNQCDYGKIKITRKKFR